MKKVVYMGAKESGYYCLDFLIEKQAEYDIEIIGVLTNNRANLTGNDNTIAALCKKHQINLIPSLEAYTKLDDFDILISVQYHQILKKIHLKKAKQIAVNLHMAPLPEYRGCNQFSFAIIDKKTTFGTTFHKMEEGIDSGDILFERRFDIDPNWNVKELYQKTLGETKLLFKEHIKDIIQANFILTSQQQLMAERGTAFHLRSDINRIKDIDLSWPKEKIVRYVKATYFPPFDPPYAIKEGEKIALTPKWISENL